MKVKLLKRHNGAQTGSVHDVSEKAAKYLVNEKVAEYVKAAKPIKVKKQADEPGTASGD